jgi:anti-anti-sigma factor
MIRIEARRVYDVLVIEMNGRLDSPSVRDAENSLLNTVEGKDGRVLLNVEKVEYLTSEGLRVIIRLGMRLQENRGELKICNARGFVRVAFELFDLQSLIKIYDTEKEAIAAFLA